VWFENNNMSLGRYPKSHGSQQQQKNAFPTRESSGPQHIYIPRNVEVLVLDVFGKLSTSQGDIK